MFGWGGQAGLFESMFSDLNINSQQVNFAMLEQLGRAMFLYKLQNIDPNDTAVHSQKRSVVFQEVLNDAQRVDLMSDLMSVSEKRVTPVEKNGAHSTHHRQNGNELFRRGHDVEALQEFTRAAAHAAPNSIELMLAYGNRSAVHMRHELFEDCIHDLELVKSIKGSALIKKLQDRFENATKLLLEKNASIANDTNANNMPSLSALNVNQKISCASDSVEMKVSEERGRHVVAVKDIQIGDVIAIEDPYVVVVQGKHALLHCHFCIKLCYALIPCDKCTYALYCSKNCRDNAFKEHHKFECPIIDSLIRIDEMDHVAFRLVIKARGDYHKISTYTSSSEEYKSDRYYEIHNMVSHKERCPLEYALKYAYNASNYYNLLLENTTFFKEDPDREVIFKSLMMHHMQAIRCNSKEVMELVALDNETTQTLTIGEGAYSFLSMVNHACDPNVIRESYGSRVVLRAISTIPAGEEILDNYGCHYSLIEKSTRQKLLKMVYMFDCSCRACRLDYPLVSNLPVLNLNLRLDWNDVVAIKLPRDVSDSEVRRISKTVMAMIVAVERYRPNRNLCELVEFFKQCLCVSANIRKF